MFGRQQQPRVALSASTASETFSSMYTLSTSGSSRDDLDELLTWLDKDGRSTNAVGADSSMFAADVTEALFFAGIASSNAVPRNF